MSDEIKTAALITVSVISRKIFEQIPQYGSVQHEKHPCLGCVSGHAFLYRNPENLHLYWVHQSDILSLALSKGVEELEKMQRWVKAQPQIFLK